MTTAKKKTSKRILRVSGDKAARTKSKKTKVGNAKAANAKPKKAAVKKVKPAVKKYLVNTAQVGKVSESNILDNVYETAKGLLDAGAIDKPTMREFDALCLPSIPKYKPKQIKAIRERFNVSQSVFAAYINVSTSSLQKWEVGSKKPNALAMKLLNLVDRKGLDVLI